MLDFIEFFKNEEMYHRQVIFDGKYFKVGEDCIFAWNKKTTAVFPTQKNGKTLEEKYDGYDIKQKTDSDGTVQYYILKSDYFSGYYFELENNVVKIKTKEISDDDLQFLTERVKVDNEKNKKRVAVYISIIVVVFIAIVMIPLCFFFDDIMNFADNFLSSCTSFVQTIAEDGTYYLKRAYTNEIDKSTYIKLSGGRWEDSDGYSGKYKISDGKIYFYINDSLFWQGTISDGEIRLESLGSYITYVKQ